jgi:hypothetical protein
MCYADNMSNIDREPSFFQVLEMEKFSKISLSLLQKDMYVKMRKTEKNLTDQRLLASIIALTNPSDLELFMNSYQNIFQAEIKKVKK